MVRCARRARLSVGALTAAVIAALVGLGAAPAPAQTTATFLLDPSSGPAGTAVEAEARGLPVGEPFLAYLRFEDAPAGDYLAEDVPITADATFEAPFVIPPGTPAGDRVVEVCVRRGSPSSPELCDRLPTARFRVTARTTTTPPPRPTTSAAPPLATPPTGPTTTSSTATTIGVGLATTTTTQPGSFAGATTTPPTTFAVGDLAASTTAPGLGMGDLAGIEGELPDLRITGMEITQGIQNRDNDMPLVAGRSTVLRVYVQTDGEPLPHVSGVLQLVRHTDQEVAVLQPDNGPLTVDGNPADRLDVDGSLNFTLPPEAVLATSQGNRLIATAFVFGTHPTTPALHEPTDVNNYEAEVFDFHGVGDLTVHVLPMHVHELPVPTAPDATYGTDLSDFFAVAATLTSLYRYHPVAGVDGILGPTVYPPLHGWHNIVDIDPALTEWDLTQDGVETSILGEVQEVWAETSSTSHLEQYYGIYPEHLPREWGGFSNGTVAYGYYHLVFGQSHPWYHGAGWLAAHELGHSIGFAHVGCTGSEGNPGDYPWSDPCTLAEVDPVDGYLGFDIRHDAFAVTDGPTVISQAPGQSAHNGYPYMGYQSSKWTDPWHYCRALERFGVECRAVPIPENAPTPTDGPDLTASIPYEPVAGQNGWVEVYGFSHEVVSPRDADGAVGDEPITALGFTVEIDDAGVVSEPLPHVLEAMAERRGRGTPSGVTAVVVDAGGSALAELELVVVNADGGDAPEDDDDISPSEDHPTTATMVDYLPWFDEAVGVQLHVDGEVVDEVLASPNAPTVEVLTPDGGELAAPLSITWQADDVDGDPLTFEVSYSPDGGATWFFVADDLPGTEHVLDDTSILAGGDEAIFRVTAHDGLRSASATSSPGVLADQPPQVLVLSPGDGATVPQHRAVTLLASAADREDRIAGTDVEVQWSSDLDGPLGVGDQLVTSALSPGTHLLTATAVDSNGGTAAMTVSLTVDAAAALERLDAEGMDAALAALAAGPADLGGTDGDARRGVVWGAAALAAVAAVAAAAAVRRSRASGRAGRAADAA